VRLIGLQHAGIRSNCRQVAQRVTAWSIVGAGAAVGSGLRAPVDWAEGGELGRRAAATSAVNGWPSFGGQHGEHAKALRPRNQGSWRIAAPNGRGPALPG
jgi:hypothetical protein